ncbi:MAG: hypothetical protein M3070_15945 [Actinomycetota bacterium]|nr:hypothetical protein [Actinomycetota bacterium]
MSDERDEPSHIVEQLPAEQLSAAPDDIRPHVERAPTEWPWPPAWFGSIRCTWRDVVARSEELLADDVSGNGSTDRVRLSDRSVRGRVNPIGGRR